MEQATDTTQAPEAVADAEAQTREAPAEQATPETTKAFDPSSISPEVQEYYKKQYGDYEQLKGEVGQFRQLTQDQRFQKWYQEMQNPNPAPAPKFEISADEHAAALGDPAKFQELVMKAAEFTANSRINPQIQQLQAQLELEQQKSVLAGVIRKNPEFSELDSKGLIEPILRRYPGISFVDAMNIAKSESGWVNKQVDDRARGQVQMQKKAITERGGNSNNSKAKKSFSNRESAMEYAYSEAQAGREVDPDDIEIS